MEMRGKPGFSLIEILLVVGLIAAIFTFIGPRIMKMFGQSDRAAMSFKMAAVQAALNDYRFELGTYPNTREGLRALLENPRPNDDRYVRAKSRWPFLAKEEDIMDKHGNELIYHSPVEQFKNKYKEYEVIYLGKTQSEDDPDRLDVGA